MNMPYNKIEAHTGTAVMTKNSSVKYAATPLNKLKQQGPAAELQRAITRRLYPEIHQKAKKGQLSPADLFTAQPNPRFSHGYLPKEVTDVARPLSLNKQGALNALQVKDLIFRAFVKGDAAALARWKLASRNGGLAAQAAKRTAKKLRLSDLEPPIIPNMSPLAAIKDHMNHPHVKHVMDWHYNDIKNAALKIAKIEGENEISKDNEQKIINYVKTHANLDDADFHKYVESLGIDPHEAEEVIYRELRKKGEYTGQLSVEKLERDYPWLAKDPVHRWRAESGIELLHREPDLPELERIIANWNAMTDAQKAISDAKSIELFGKTNMDRIAELRTLYTKQAGLRVPVPNIAEYAKQLPSLAKQSVYAPGIPDKNYFGDVNKELALNDLAEFVLQKHETLRRPNHPHNDLRIGVPGKTKGTFSWAVPNAQLPEVGEKKLVVQTPVHEHGYSNFTGRLGKGYGAGNVTMAQRGKALITKVTPNTINFSLSDSRVPTRYTLVKLNTDRKTKDWLLIRRALPGAVKGVGDKPVMKVISADDVDEAMQHAEAIQAKIDGACLPPGERILTDQGWIKIKDIVNKRLKVNVAGRNKKGDLVFNPVTNYFKYPKTEDWVTIRAWTYPRKPKYLTTTRNHKIYTVNGKKFACELTTKDTVYALSAGMGLIEAKIDLIRHTPKNKGYYNNCKFVYDIEVANTHNYIAEGILISNSMVYSLNPKGVEAYSVSKSVKGEPIIHSERLGTLGAIPPKELQDTILRGEAFGIRDGKAIPFQEVGGLLNSSISKSIQTQKDKKIQMLNALFDVVQHQGKPPPESYTDRKVILDAAVKALGKGFITPPQVTGADAGKKLLAKIQSGKHPLTGEGIILRMPGGGTLKYKIRPESTVYFAGIYPGRGKRKDIAGLMYALEPGGKPVGNAGTGFTDADLRDILRRKDELIGSPMRISHQGQFKETGAYRAPAFQGWDVNELDKNASLLTKLNATPTNKLVRYALASFLPYIPIAGRALLKKPAVPVAAITQKVNAIARTPVTPAIPKPVLKTVASAKEQMLDRLWNATAYVESGGSNWIGRTKIRPPGKLISTAYGPVQITLTKARDTLNRYGDKLSAEEYKALQDIIIHGNKLRAGSHLKPGQLGYKTWGYGGTGTMTNEQQQAAYRIGTKAIMRIELEGLKDSPDIIASFAKRWRGINSPTYIRKLKNKYKELSNHQILKKSEMTKLVTQSMAPINIVDAKGNVKATARAALADTDTKRRKGLSKVAVLPKDTGMLFDRCGSVWMKDCFIPLSVAFLDKCGTIVDIQHMPVSNVPDADQPVYRSKSDKAACFLEMAEGWFDKHNIKPGDKIVVG